MAIKTKFTLNLIVKSKKKKQFYTAINQQC